MSIAKAQKHNKMDSRPSKKPRKELPDIQFHNIRLTKADRQELDIFCQKLLHIDASPLELLVEGGGYKVSVRYDSDSESFMVSMTGSDVSPNPNICVTTYGENIEETLIMSLYKAWDIDKAEWLVWELAPEQGNKRWG